MNMDNNQLTDERIDALFAEKHDPKQSPWDNWRRFARAIQAELSALPAAQPVAWEDKRDRWSPMIDASHPMETGAHDAYATAMEMVGNRHSKGELVELVCWLVQRVDMAEDQLRKPSPKTGEGSAIEGGDSTRGGQAQ
jgi:hypothetical protein